MMKRLFIGVGVVLALVLAGCGGTGPGSGSSAINIDDPPYLDQSQTQFPADLIRGIVPLLAPSPIAADMTKAIHTPRVAAMCGNGVMTVYGAMRTPTFTLSFDFALLSYADQNILSVGPYRQSALDVHLHDGALYFTVNGQTIVWNQLFLATAWQHVDITLGDDGMLSVYVNNALAGTRFEVYGPFSAPMLRVGGAKGVLPGMCGAIDNLELYDNSTYNMGGGRVVEPSNPWLVKYDFDGPANNAGRLATTMVFEGIAGLVNY